MKPPTQSEALGYDALSRLTSVASGGDNETFSYDANGNRISQTVNGAQLTYGISATSNQLASTSGASNTQYGYDAPGNTVLINGTPSYQYNAFNRMNTAASTSYYVNPEGQRLSKQGSGNPTYFAPDASGALLAESNQGNGWIDYIWLNGRLISRLVNTHLNAIYDDHLGRPEILLDPQQSGVIIWKAQNLPFTRNVTTQTAGTLPLNLGFPGQYYDSETDLWNNSYRDNNSRLGRYLQSDPARLAGGINTYAYADENPILTADPSGLAVFTFGVSGVLAHLSGLTPNGGYYFDTSGNYGTYQTFGGGFSTLNNASISASLGLFGSVGSQSSVTYKDFAGPFLNASGDYGADGISGGLELYMDPMAPSHFGGALNFGGGLPGASGTLGASNTVVCNKGNVFTDLMNAIANQITLRMQAEMGLH